MITYRQHYQRCQYLYGSADNSVYNTTVHINDIEYDTDIFESFRGEMSNRLKNRIGCVEDKWSIKLDQWRDMGSIEDFCQQVMPQIEERYFDSHLSVDFVHPYKTKIDASLESSWEWHYDDCPKEYIKFVIMLNETNENNGCMQYVSKPNGTIPVVETYRLDPSAVKGFPPPVYPKTRIPQLVVDDIVNRGGKINSITGPPGTNFIFTPNVMHRGTIPSSDSDPREALFFFIRPTSAKRRKYINDKTNSFIPEMNVKKYNLD